jgi:predicted nucleic acid-binding protein
MRTLLDTNVVLGVALERLPFSVAAGRIFNAPRVNQIQLFITASMATDVYYLVRKRKGREVALEFLIDLLGAVDVCHVDKGTLLAALSSGFNDFEDAVQSAAVVEAKIDVIVTRNKADYSSSPLTVLTPDEFVSLHLA